MNDQLLQPLEGARTRFYSQSIRAGKSPNSWTVTEAGYLPLPRAARSRLSAVNAPSGPGFHGMGRRAFEREYGVTELDLLAMSQKQNPATVRAVPGVINA